MSPANLFNGSWNISQQYSNISFYLTPRCFVHNDVCVVYLPRCTPTVLTTCNSTSAYVTLRNEDPLNKSNKQTVRANNGYQQNAGYLYIHALVKNRDYGKADFYHGRFYKLAPHTRAVKTPEKPTTTTHPRMVGNFSYSSLLR